MDENDVMRKYAESHGFDVGNDQYDAPRPLPCVRDEHGEIREQTLKAMFSKINEELDELKELILINNCLSGKTGIYSHGCELEARMAEEAADTITAITTMLEALGIDAEMRDEAQRRVNAKNRSRGRL